MCVDVYIYIYIYVSTGTEVFVSKGQALQAGWRYEVKCNVRE